MKIMTENLAFFFDTADHAFINTAWSLLKDKFPPASVRGITTNPSAFNKENIHNIDKAVERVVELSKLLFQIRGDSKGELWIQIPNSEMKLEEIKEFHSHFKKANLFCSLGLKIPPFLSHLEMPINDICNVNVTGISDCGTALRAMQYSVKYVSLLTGRMEEQGIRAPLHLAFAASAHSAWDTEIIAGSMRTIEQVNWACKMNAVPTIGKTLWNILLEPSILPKLPEIMCRDSSEIVPLKFAPANGDKETLLSLAFFKQMDEFGASMYGEINPLFNWLR